MPKSNISKRLSLLTVAVLFALSYLTVLHIPWASASTPPFNMAFLRLDNLTATTYTTARTCFQPTVTTAIHSIVIQFPTTSGADYVIDQTASDWGFNTTGLDSGETAVPDLPSHPTVSSKQVTVTLTSDLTPVTSDLYCFNFALAAGSGIIKTPSAGATETTHGYIQTNTAASAVINQTAFSESIITNNSVVVNATVPPSFTFVLGGNTDTFPSDLSTGSINQSDGNTITITTNAASGWIIWAKDLNYKTVTDSGSSPANEHGALESATAGNYTISNNSANSLGTASHVFTAGTEDYGLGSTINSDAAGGGTVVLNAAYNGTSSHYAGVLDPTQYRPVASSNGTANGDVLNVYELATIAGQTPAASDYTDTIYYVGAGQF